MSTARRRTAQPTKLTLDSEMELPLEIALGFFLDHLGQQQQADDIGDGTTTVAVLTHALIHECLKRPENPMVIKQSLKEAGDKVLKILAKQSVKLKKEDIEKVALISSEDKQIAKLITEIIDKLGEKAVVNVEDSKKFDVNADEYYDFLVTLNSISGSLLSL